MITTETAVLGFVVYASAIVLCLLMYRARRALLQRRKDAEARQFIDAFIASCPPAYRQEGE